MTGLLTPILMALFSAPAAVARGDSARFEHELTLWAIPAPRPLGLTWSRPGRLVRRTIFNEALDLNRGIGHAGITLQCGATDERPAAHWQGSVRSTGDDFRRLVFEDKAGMGILFAAVPGRLDREDELQETLELRARRGQLAWIRTGIPGETCHALLDYVRGYDERAVDDLYGFVRPLHQEGAGCSAFSMAFLYLAGLEEPWMREEWIFDVRIPTALIGGELHPGNEVGLLRLLSITRGWADPGEAHIRLNGWDPTFMFHSIQARAEGHAVEVERWRRAVGLVVDRRHTPARPALLEGRYFTGEPAWDSEQRFLTAEE